MKNLEKYLNLLNDEVDGLLLTSRYSRHYGAEYDIAEGIAVVSKAGCRYFTDSRYIESAQNGIKGFEVIEMNAKNPYNDLLNKPTIPAAQVQSDWNEADNTKVDYIKNKPTIPDVSGKADKVAGATSGDVATLDSTGNLTDSGLSVFDFFVMVEDASTPPASMAPNTVYKYGTLSGNTTFPPLATPTEPDIANVYCWTFTTPSTAPTITWPVAITAWAGGSAPTINASKNYEVSVLDGIATIIEA